MPGKRKDSDSSADEGEADKNDDKDEVFVRQDQQVVITHERELRNIDQVKVKISQFTGVIIRIKTVTVQCMENLLAAIEADAVIFQQQQSLINPVKMKPSSQPVEMGGLSENAPVTIQTPSSGIVSLKFEDCIIQTKALQILKVFLSTKQLIESFYIQKVEFQDPIQDFRLLIEGLQFSIKIRKVGILNMVFDEEPYGKQLCHLLNDCRQLREFDASNCEFFHPKCFFEMCQSLISEKSRISVIKLKGLHITNLEGKVLQFVLMKNKSLHTLDLTGSKIDSGECLEFFLQKIDKYSNIRYLILENIQPDLSTSLEILGEALSENLKLEVLILRENKLKWVPYCNFWENLKGNVSLQKINLSKTDLTDRVLEKLSSYINNQSIRLVDLDLSRNQLTDIGLTNLSEALLGNNSIKYLNLSQNGFRDNGLRSLVTYLSQSNCSLIELSLSGNKINNEGIQIISEFIKPNTSLKMLDISKNNYGDQAFSIFAQEMGQHANLTYLDISKSKELNDEGSLITLARQLAVNTHLQTLDLSNVRVRKPYLKLYLEPSLKQNITLKYVLGKLTPDIIEEQLNINIQIQTDVEPNFLLNAKVPKFGFDVHLVDPDCNSLLNMKDQNSSLFDAAFKFIQQKDVRQVDLTNMQLQDQQLFYLAAYLQTIPNLRSLILNNNSQITDDGMTRIANSLISNNKLAHLEFRNCRQLGNNSLIELNKVLSDDNMMMCSIDFDEKHFDVELGRALKRETVLNRAIQENLKPTFFQKPKSMKSLHHSSHENLLIQTSLKNLKHSNTQEVVFIEDAPVYKYLSSAIKCWRITRPVVIQIENQQLTDKHVIELCDFLKDREMIVNLNLRRNRITNIGALAIIDWIMNHDTTLTNLDVSRNRITRAGAQAFLGALQRITRITDFQISYGNPIPLDINLSIGYEVLANNQIKANQSNSNFNSKFTITNSKYELIDRGPMYMRCAIKSVELLKITHLSLPDNMLGFEEAKMLAAMIRVNPPLKTLNLEINNLDAQCAKLIADALKSNTNLELINISKNKLSDLGINYLLQSLIKSRLLALKELKQEKKEHLPIRKLPSSQSLEPKSPLKVGEGSKLSQKQQPLSPQQSARNQSFMHISPIQNSENMTQNKLQDSITIEDIKRCEMGQLKVLNIVENMSTLESYKVIWTLLVINPQVLLHFDSPQQLQLQIKNQHQQQQEQQIKSLKNQAQLKGQTNEESQAQLFKNGLTSSRTMIDIEQQDHSQINDEAITENLNLVQQQEVIVHQRSACLICCVKNNKKITKCCSVFCCFKKHQFSNNNDDETTCGEVVCWRFNNCKQKVHQFQPIVEKMTSFDKVSIQNTLATFLILNQVGLYIFVIIPFIIPEKTASVVLAIFLAYILMFELVVVLIARSTVSLSILNPYLYFQLFSGLLKKAALLSLGLIGGICVTGRSIGGEAIGAVSLLAIVLDQLRTIQALYQTKKIDASSVLPLMERTQKISEILNYQALVIVFKKVSLLPSKNSEQLSQKIALELNPDLIKPPTFGINKIFDQIKAGYISNFVARHLIFIDLILLLVIVISLGCSWSRLSEGVIAAIILLLCDSTSCLAQLKEDQPIVSLNPKEVYAIAAARILELGERYNNVIMKEEEENPQQMIKNEDEYEGALMDTVQSQSGYPLQRQLSKDLEKDDEQELDVSVTDRNLKIGQIDLISSATIENDPIEKEKSD